MSKLVSHSVVWINDVQMGTWSCMAAISHFEPIKSKLIFRFVVALLSLNLKLHRQPDLACSPQQTARLKTGSRVNLRVQSCLRMSMKRRSKRARSNPPPTADRARHRYLDTVADDNLRIVLRYLSCRPHYENWHAYVSPLSVNIALDVGGALARAALLEFRGVGGKDGIPIRAVLNVSILRPLLNRLVLHRLVLQLRGDKVLPDLLRGCGAELMELVLRARGTMVTEADILAISSHCTKLESLEIRGTQVEIPLAPIWRSLGSTLTRIFLCSYCHTSGSGYRILDVMSVHDMAEHCVNLRRVDAEKLMYHIAYILIALGTRIRVLSIEDDSDSSIVPWREVYGACTNLKAVSLTLHSSVQAIDVLSLMHTKLVSLTLRILPNLVNLMSTEDQFFSALSACSLLKEVKLLIFQLIPEELLRKLFGSLKSVTTLTCVMNLSNVNLNNDIIDVIASNLTNLESLTISTDIQLKGDDVNALVDLPRLKSVSIRPPLFMKSISKPAEVCAVEIVNKLKDCAQLLQLDIHDVYINRRSPLIAEAAVMYDRKDFDMFIGGVQYRTW